MYNRRKDGIQKAQQNVTSAASSSLSVDLFIMFPEQPGFDKALLAQATNVREGARVQPYDVPRQRRRVGEGALAVRAPVHALVGVNARVLGELASLREDLRAHLTAILVALLVYDTHVLQQVAAFRVGALADVAAVFRHGSRRPVR